ncbi:MAG: HEPN domain-containing protein [Caldilineaceae bacterium]|nr:HEPN domain-containing protein [Caldilineaceae bacterium]HRJ40336.1 HEPN domain-containing protein [Caldilineaceae bacterium]
MSTTERDGFHFKARQSLQGAESELAQQRFDNAINRAYYAAFQSAIVALMDAGISVHAETGGILSHQAVHSNFANLLIHRRKLYPSRFRNVLQDLLRDRIIADYRSVSTSSVRATRAVQQCRTFIDEILA